jgi:hypothetical protein
MDKLDKAVARIRGEWPSDPIPWIFTTPDQGKTVYRAIRTDVCPDIFKDSHGQPVKQLYQEGGIQVGFDNTYGD